MEVLDAITVLDPAAIWLLLALLGPCLLAMTPTGNAQKGGRP